MSYLLLGTSGCHLCELAEEIIDDCHSASNFPVKLIDIAEQTHWQHDFATRIPVLLHQKSSNCLCWPFTKNDVLTFLKQNHD